MKKISVGGSMAKCTLKVATVLQKEIFAAINLLTIEGNIVHMKTFSSCFDKLLPLAVKDAILTFEQLAVKPPYKPDFHKSPYNYELIFGDSSKVKVVTVQGNHQIPQQHELFDEIGNGDLVVIKCGMDGSFGQIGKPPRCVAVVVDKALQSCELYVRDMKMDVSGNYGSDKLLKVIATCCIKNQQKQLIARSTEDVTVLADEIPESFFSDEADEPFQKKTKIGNFTDESGSDSITLGGNPANFSNNSATNLQTTVENFALVSSALFDYSTDMPIEDEN